MSQIFSNSALDSIIDSTANVGTNTSEGYVSSGDFALPGKFGANQGVGIGQAIPTVNWVCASDVLNITTYSSNELIVGAGATSEFPLSKYISPANSLGVSYTQYFANSENSFLRFANPTQLFITSPDNVDNIQIKISYIDRYGQYGTLNINNISIAADGVWVSPICVYDLYQLRITNNDTNPYNLYVGIWGSVELPYYNLGTSANLMTMNLAMRRSTPTAQEQLNIFNFPCYTGAPASNAEYFTPTGLGGAFITNPLVQLSAPVNNPRPIVNPSQIVISLLQSGKITEEQLNDFYLTVVQNVFGFGTSLPKYWLDQNIPQDGTEEPGLSVLSNYPPVVIGAPPISTNWEASNV